jgi:uroporphyrin-III C-methyltransferase/precorrin-2 dehydrogenase/sirohydrochlorin ferrochelatase
MLDNCALVISATSSDRISGVVAEAAQSRGIPFNAVDRTALSTFIMPSIVDRSPLVAAISSGGRSPVLARMVREKLESLLPSGLGAVAAIAGSLRDEVRRRLPTVGLRRRFWESLFQGPGAQRLLARPNPERAIRLHLDEFAGQSMNVGGEVYLVGAGPGDADLLTCKALQLMQQADVVLYDRLVAPETLSRVRRDAERIFVGKASGRHALPQDHINRLLVDLARDGKRVLRLKGGDPFLFGRGGEEIDDLKRAGVPFQVVPGITAALGCAAYAGIPLTHRDHAQACLFVTGHLQDGSLDLPWTAMTQPKQTVVIYMGLGALPELCQGLQEHGLADDWPAALIERGTSPDQRVVTGTIASLPGLAVSERLRPPTLIILGDVVALRDRLEWFQPRFQDTADRQAVC